jgi:hypothetical protein
MDKIQKYSSISVIALGYEVDDRGFESRQGLGILLFTTVLGYGLDGRVSRVWFPAGVGNFSLHHRVQNGSEAHTSSYPMNIRFSLPGGKGAGA